MRGFILLLPLILIVTIGMFLRKVGVVDKKASYFLNNLLYWAILPIWLFRTILRVDIGLFSNLNLFFALHVPFLIAPAIAWFFASRIDSERKRVAFSTLNAIRSNNIFIGMPVVSLALGQQGVESLSFFFAMGLLGYNLFSISWAQLCLSGTLNQGSITSTLKQIFLNPLIWACLIGVVSSSLGINGLPQWVDYSFKIIADASSGIALLSLGISLELSNLKNALINTWRDSLMRLIIFPGIVWAAFLVWPVDPIISKTIILVSAMPSAINNFAIAQGMGMDLKYASEAIVASTVLVVITLPIWTNFLQI